MQFQTIRDNDGEMMMVSSRPFVDSDWPVWFVIKLVECDEYDREWARQGRYHVEVSAVSLEAAGDMGCRAAARAYGIELSHFRAYSTAGQVEVLHSQGIRAPLWQDQGNNRGQLLRAARREVKTLAAFTFGFAMDRSVNAIGETGWDWIRGGPGASVRA